METTKGMVLAGFLAIGAGGPAAASDLTPFYRTPYAAVTAEHARSEEAKPPAAGAGAAADLARPEAALPTTSSCRCHRGG